MAKSKGTKRFDLMMWMENYIYLGHVADETGVSMAEQVNRILEKYRKHSDIMEMKSASRRTQ